jgi:F-type H+-transporting ATPase subunit b
VVRLEAGILTLNATLVVQLITFLLTLLFLYRVAWGPVLKALEARQKRIQEGLEAAQKAQEDRAAAERAYAEKLAEARQEAQRMLDQATKMGETLRQELEQKARQQASQIIEQARAEIDRERLKALQDLRRQVADLAVLAAGRVIGESLDGQKHRELIERTISEAEINV